MKLTVEQFVEWLRKGDGYRLDESPMLTSCGIDFSGDDSDTDGSYIIADFSWVDDDLNKYEVYVSKESIENGIYYPDTQSFVFKDCGGCETTIFVYNFIKVSVATNT